MKLKSYHAETVEAAARLAEIELGESAVFLGSRKTEGEESRYEVTFAVPERPVVDSVQPPPVTAPLLPQQPWTATETPAGEEPEGEEEVPRNGLPARGGEPAATLAAQQAPTPAPTPALGLPHWKKFVPEMIEDEADPGPPGASGEEPGTELPAGPGPGIAQRRFPLSRFALGGQERSSPVANSSPSVLCSNGKGSFGAESKGPEIATLGGVASQSAPRESAIPRSVGAGAAAAARAPRSAQPTVPGAAASALEPETSARPSSRSTRRLSDAVTRLSDDFAKLRHAIEVHQPVQNIAFLSNGELLSDPMASQAYLYLTRNEVEPTLAAHLLTGLEGATGQGMHRDQLWEILGQRLELLCRTANLLGLPGAEPRAAALIGPSGTGKTTTIAKLAFRYGLAADRNIRLVTIDPIRVGAAEHLEAYAAVLDMDVTRVAEAEALPGALESIMAGKSILAGRDGPQDQEPPDLILIDTPGYSPAEWEQARRLAKVLIQLESVDIHLVLGATAKPGDLRRNIEDFRMFRPDKLLFTRLDETGTFGSILNETVRTRLPLSFFTNGQRVPEDLAPATAPFVLDLLLNKTVLH